MKKFFYQKKDAYFVINENGNFTKIDGKQKFDATPGNRVKLEKLGIKLISASEAQRLRDIYDRQKELQNNAKNKNPEE